MVIIYSKELFVNLQNAWHVIRGDREWLLWVRELEREWKGKEGRGREKKEKKSQNSGKGKQWKKSIPKIREREATKISIPIFQERESEALIPGNGREHEFPLTPACRHVWIPAGCTLDPMDYPGADIEGWSQFPVEVYKRKRKVRFTFYGYPLKITSKYWTGDIFLGDMCMRLFVCQVNKKSCFELCYTLLH